MNGGWSYRSVVGRSEAGLTVLEYLVRRHAHSTRATWASRIGAGEVELGGHAAHTDEPLRRGDVLVWHRPPWREPDVPRRVDLLYEDGDVVAVSKPSGLPTLPAGGFLEHTLLRFVQARYPEARPLHRLGRCTSGVVLFARTAAAASSLAHVWRERAVDKEYRALAAGVPAWRTCEVTTPIGPVPHPTLGSVHAAHPAGRPAHSRLEVVEPRRDAVLLDVRITTGRPHQIRIHTACTGHPLVGDPLYAAGGSPRAVDPGLPGDGGYLLHARRLRCTHPRGHGDLVVEAPLPDALIADVDRGRPASIGVVVAPDDDPAP